MEMDNSRQRKPCAACRCLKRRCREKDCPLAPCFPSNDPDRFLLVHRVFGASNIIRLLQDVGVDQRRDAANSFVFEANMRMRDPVYGCAGLVHNMQRYISDLQTQLAVCQAQIQVLQASYFQSQILQASQNPGECDWQLDESLGI